MRSRRLAGLVGSDPVGRLLAGVWIAGHVVAAAALGAVITEHPTAAVADSSATSPDRTPAEQSSAL